MISGSRWEEPTERARSGGFKIGRNSLRDGKGVNGKRKRDHNKTSSTKKKKKTRKHRVVEKQHLDEHMNRKLPQV